MAFDRHDRRPIDVTAQDELVKGAAIFILFQDCQKLLFVMAEISGQKPQRLFRILCIFGNEQKIEGRPAVDEEPSLPVENHAAGCRDSLDADSIVF